MFLPMPLLAPVTSATRPLSPKVHSRSGGSKAAPIRRTTICTRATCRGRSGRPRRRCRNSAARAPSTTRWSDDERHRHHRPDADVAARRPPRGSLIAPTARMPACGGTMIAVNASTLEHPEVADGEGGARDVGRRQAVGARALGQLLALLGDVAERQPVGVADHGGHDGVLAPPSPARRSPRRCSWMRAVRPAAVHARELAQRRAPRRRRGGRCASPSRRATARSPGCGARERVEAGGVHVARDEEVRHRASSSASCARP